VRRILYTSSIEKLQKKTQGIQRIAALIFEKTIAQKDAFEHIFQWHFDTELKTWIQMPTDFSKQMLWERIPLGIGTTTNHAESFHRTMNANTRKNDPPTKKLINFRNNIVRKIKNTNNKSGRQVHEHIKKVQKSAMKHNIEQREFCVSCDTSRYIGRFLCQIPCIHTCLKYDLKNIPQMEKISMKTTRLNKIHLKKVEDNWTFMAQNYTDQTEPNSNSTEEGTKDEEDTDEIEFLIADCRDILQLRTAKITKSFIAGIYAMFKRNFSNETEEEIKARFTIFLWDEAKKKWKGIFSEMIQRDDSIVSRQDA
jgi:hypothetical protein